MKVFKFGGASVKDAEAVRNMAKILDRFSSERLLVVVSAMGKTTNALEVLVQAWQNRQKKLFDTTIQEIKHYHFAIMDALFPAKGEEIKLEIQKILAEIIQKYEQPFSDNYDFEYDQIVSLGEVISTKIIASYLQTTTTSVLWCDARQLIRTDRTFRNGNVVWQETERLIADFVQNNSEKILVTQGFIGHTAENFTTTLGREGSDYTAGIFAYCTNAKDVTIWKDVPGMLNADPKYFENTVMLNQISYKEAIELAYYGASVIHPKTLKPLQNKSIPLYVKSFLSPEDAGTIIHESTSNDAKIASFIFKKEQTLISVMPTDFSFIAESSLQKIFQCLANENVSLNLMQNSAVSFSFLVDSKKVNLEKLVRSLSKDFQVKYNENLELVTIRHYNEEIIREITKNRTQLMTQSDRQTIRIVLQ